MEIADVVLVRWPSERNRLDAVRARGEPRLVVVEEGSPPVGDDCLEDWLRAPVDVDELRVRVDTLRSRAHRHDQPPAVDGDGVLRYSGRVVTLPPVQRQLASALLERRGSVVSREALAKSVWPDGTPRERNVLDVHMARLRRTLTSIGLELKTVRRRGYLLLDREELAGAE
jgi:DNA-binding response OmpR family regulator